MKNYSRSIDISELAALTFLSVSQFERRFKSMFKITPMKYVSLVRINAACEALAAGKERISEISYQNGFYDLSHFNRQFKKTMGMAPSLFRRKYFQADDYPRIPGLQIQKTWGKPPEGYLPSRK
jgi:AraC-like DNA-binding protein